jgi:hypothetical protein
MRAASLTTPGSGEGVFTAKRTSPALMAASMSGPRPLSLLGRPTSRPTPGHAERPQCRASPRTDSPQPRARRPARAIAACRGRRATTARARRRGRAAADVGRPPPAPLPTPPADPDGSRSLRHVERHTSSIQLVQHTSPSPHWCGRWRARVFLLGPA